MSEVNIDSPAKVTDSRSQCFFYLFFFLCILDMILVFDYKYFNIEL